MDENDEPRVTDDGLVTVGLPTYNRRLSAMRAAESVVQQGYQPVRLVISDNASEDGTTTDLRRLADGSAGIRLLENTINIGPSANFERVRTEAAGEFFMWLGDDDWLDENYIGACVRELDSDQHLVMVAGACRYHEGENTWLESPLINLLQDGSAERVLGYFRSVSSNGAFYGVARREALVSLPPVPNVMGGDWLHLARLAFLGKIRTLESVEVHRSVGGATRSLAHVAKHQQLGWLSRNAPQIALAWLAFTDISWRSPVYEPLGRTRRFVLGARSSTIIFARFVPSAAAKFVRQHRKRLTNAPTSDLAHGRHARVEP